MRIILVGPVYPYRGGIAHYTTMLARALREHDHDLLLVSFKRQYPQWLFPGRSDKDPSKSPLEVEEARYWLDSVNPITWLTTFSRIKRYDPDTIVLQWWTTFWSPVWCALALLNELFLHKPLIYICHNVLPHERHLCDSILARAALRWGTRFVVQSGKEKKDLQALISGAQIDIVPHPIYDIFANQRMSKTQARKQLGLPPNLPVLLFFGIVREYKGLRDLLEALPRIKAQLGNVKLVVAGEFWEDRSTYDKMIEQLGIGDSVILEDRYILNEEIPLYYSAADLLVAPYRRVTGSGAAQFAQGFKVPVIKTWKEGDQQNANQATSQLSVPPGDAGALATAIIAFFEQDLRSREPWSVGDRQDAPAWDSLVRLIEETIA